MGALYQDVLSEDISLKCYVRKYADEPVLSAEFVQSLLEQAQDNQYMLHCIYSHITLKDGVYTWESDVNILDSLKGKEPVFATEFKK